VGLGLLFPAITPQGRWGGPHGVIRGASGALRPAPTRYMLLSSNNLGLFPSLGAGYRLSDAVRVGAALEWGMVAIEHRSMAAMAGNTTPAGDIEARVTGVDWFVPAVNASVHLVPADAVDLVLAFRYQDDLRMPAQVALTTGLFDPNLLPHTTELSIAELRQAMPWKLRAGVRYASRLRPRPTGSGHDEGGPWKRERVHDALEDERWDVELDVEYQINSRVRDQVLRYRTGQRLWSQPIMGDPGSVTFPPNPAHPSTIIEKRWRDQVSVRLGGTYNLVPGALGVSLGAHYETRGIDPNYMQIDFWPVARVGLHAGLLLRLSRVVDLSLAYAHIRNENLIVAPPPHRDASEISDTYATEGLRNVDQRVGPAPDRSTPAPILEAPLPGQPDGEARLSQNLVQVASGQPPYLVNAGRYRSHMNVISAGLHFHF
jgi:hypothetical protein